MAAAAVLRGGSCRVLAYPALHADVISSPATLPTCPRPRGSSRRGTLGEVHGHLHPHEAISRPGIQRNYREDGRTCCFSTPTSPLSSSASPPPPLGKMAAAALANGDVRVGVGGAVPRPTNPMVTPLLTDLYRFSMAYAYWKAGKHLDRAV